MIVQRLIQKNNRSVSHSVWSVGGGFNIAVSVLGSAQRLPLGSLVIGDHRLYSAVCQKSVSNLHHILLSDRRHFGCAGQ